MKEIYSKVDDLVIELHLLKFNPNYYFFILLIKTVH